MNRRVVCSVVVLGLIMGFAASNSPAQREVEKNVDQTLKRLLTSRRDVLKRVYEVTKRRHEDGTGGFDSYILARDAYLLAQFELAESKKQRIEICKERVENLRRLEESAKVRSESGSAKIEEQWIATAVRLQAEIDCVKEESKPD